MLWFDTRSLFDTVVLVSMSVGHYVKGSDEICRVVARVTENIVSCTVFASNKGYLSYGPLVLIHWNEVLRS
jgi:hypothetical protein